MKSSLLVACMSVVGLHGLAYSQIYADFSVSHGGSPVGTFRVRLNHDKAPRTCANFIGLATGQRAWLDTTTGRVVSGKPYYNGLKFHRLLHSFVIQGGDPQGDGTGGPGYVVQDEYDNTLLHSGRYILSMANSGTNTNGSQFFITLRAAHELDYKHSVFGEVINDATHPAGKSIIDDFANPALFPTNGSSPVQPIVIESVVVSGPDLASFDINDPALSLPQVSGVKNEVDYDPALESYRLTWDRKPQTEYLASFTTDLNTWSFLQRSYHLSMNGQPAWQFTVNGVTSDRFFSRMAEVDYGLVPNAPDDLTGAGNRLLVRMNDTELLIMDFDGNGGGTWELFGGGTSGVLSDVAWTDSAPQGGYFTSSAPQANYIPLGNLRATFDTAVGSEQWKSLNFTLSFHTVNDGWTVGSVKIQASGGGFYTATKRLPYNWTPSP